MSLEKQIRITVIAFIILSLSGCATIQKPRPWTKDEKIAGAFFLAGHTADAYTTLRHQDYPDRIYERNPILGKHPEDHEIYLYIGATTLLALAVTHFIPELRFPVCIGYGGLGFYLAWGNYKTIRKVKE